MRYRFLGRTGLRVSELGLGGHEYRRWLPGQRSEAEFQKTQPQRTILVEKAIDAGVNYFDTTFADEAESLGLALKALGRREDVYISAMMVELFKKMEEAPPTRWRKIILDAVEERLRLLQTGYIDIFRICMPENDYSPHRFRTTWKVLAELKDQGKVGSIGASSHELGFLDKLIRTYDCFDSIMVRYNYYLQHAKETPFPLCKDLNIGLVIMKPFAWPYYGISFTRFRSVRTEEEYRTPAQTNLRWILNRSEVATIVPGVNTLDELEENLAAVTKEDLINEEVLERHLETALGRLGKERLKEMLQDPAIDVSYYANRALASEK